MRVLLPAASVGGMKASPSMLTKVSKSGSMMAGPSGSKSFRQERNKKAIDIISVLYQAAQITGKQLQRSDADLVVEQPTGALSNVATRTA